MVKRQKLLDNLIRIYDNILKELLNNTHFENVTFLKMIVDKHKPIIEHLYLLKESKDNIEYELIEMR